ncbi:energy transducer TonB, partial [Variovorax sp. KK3]
PKAPYPAESFAAREQGTVLLRVQTTPAGRPTIVEVKQSSGYSRLDRSAVETVRKWQFKPTPDDGTEVGREVPIGFAIIH